MTTCCTSSSFIGQAGEPRVVFKSCCPVARTFCCWFEGLCMWKSTWIMQISDVARNKLMGVTKAGVKLSWKAAASQNPASRGIVCLVWALVLIHLGNSPLPSLFALHVLNLSTGLWTPTCSDFLLMGTFLLRFLRKMICKEKKGYFCK